MKTRSLVVCFMFMVSLSVLYAIDESPVVSLWPNGAPGFESRRNEPERAQDYWVKNINNPTLTVFTPPKEKTTGAAVVICPGGGHRELVFNAEGVEVAQFFRSLGVTAFVLKYRLAREPNSPYSLPETPSQDGMRALRYVRSHAADYGLDPHRIGIVGFSAGGEVAALVSFGANAGHPESKDPIDRESARPDFDVFIYPGPLGFPATIPSDAPPAFFLVSMNDKLAGKVLDLLPLYRSAKVPIEAHLYSHGQHGFNLGHRSEFRSLQDWPDRLADWLIDSGYLFQSATPAPGSVGRP